MLSKNLKEYRKKKNYSMFKLSQESGVSDRIISYIESGKCKNPHINTLLAISSVLDVSIEDLIK